ncbi:hypothetical protein Tco_1342349 [Tanacetum coccineum]
MTRPKIKQVPNKSCTPSDPDMEECVRDGWVVVKKQKVTILIPPLPITEQCVMPNLVETPSQPIAAKKVDRITAPQPDVDHITALHPDPPLTLEKTMPLLPTTKPIAAYSNPPKIFRSNRGSTRCNWRCDNAEADDRMGAEQVGLEETDGMLLMLWSKLNVRPQYADRKLMNRGMKDMHFNKRLLLEKSSLSELPWKSTEQTGPKVAGIVY